MFCLVARCGRQPTCSPPASAHHSHNNYATSEFTFIEGVVKEIHFLNPHSWVYMEVRNEKGDVVRCVVTPGDGKAVETVVGFLKDRLPGPLAGQLDNALDGGGGQSTQGESRGRDRAAELLH